MNADTSLVCMIGDIEIHRIVELEAGELIHSIIPDAKTGWLQAVPWLTPHYVDQEGNLKSVVQSFLLKSADHTILIDPCNGNCKQRTDIPEWSDLHTGFLDSMTELGVAPEQIDTIVCTHLHVDHVGWNTSPSPDSWTPTFPNATHYFVQDEYDYWNSKPGHEIADDKAAFDDSVKPIVQAGLAELVDTDHHINDYLSFIPTPGHTPHHASILIESGGDSALITGDTFHHPCQIAFPTWGTEADSLPGQAADSRQKILDLVTNTDTLLIGSHFPEPAAGLVTKSKTGYRFTAKSA